MDTDRHFVFRPSFVPRDNEHCGQSARVFDFIVEHLILLSERIWLADFMIPLMAISANRDKLPKEFLADIFVTQVVDL